MMIVKEGRSKGHEVRSGIQGSHVNETSSFLEFIRAVVEYVRSFGLILSIEGPFGFPFKFTCESRDS